MLSSVEFNVILRYRFKGAEKIVAINTGKVTVFFLNPFFLRVDQMKGRLRF